VKYPGLEHQGWGMKSNHEKLIMRVKKRENLNRWL
jgi:hypothetical protein